jgi:pantoate--beta-alanine ligase
MSSKRIFVPTMGALHDGHLELIKRAHAISDDVLVSIFVNPLQFENPDDLAKYPRDLDGDREKALAAGASEIWAPSYDEVYPGDIEHKSAGAVGSLYEGVKRPGHFDGMLTVVAALFKKVKPDIAIFGEKDFQQLHIVRNWVARESESVEILAAPIVRESDGLAMSSRNVRLSKEGRSTATVISRALRSGSKTSALEILGAEPLFTLDYLDIINPEDFSLATTSTANPRAIIAGWIDGVRLLDNMDMQVCA